MFQERTHTGLDSLQKISMSLMGVLVLITFVGANLHAFLWQSSDWLVSTVLPSVVVDLTNEERADNSATPLVRNSTLDQAAKLKAQHMAENEYFSHFSPTGVSPWYWFDQAGYVYAHAGENLAIHFTDSSEVVDAWMKSPTHRQNIVSGLYTEIGVGTAKGEFDGYDTVYVVQLFGTPAATTIPVPSTSEPLAVAETEVPVLVETESVAVVTEVIPEVQAVETDFIVDEIVLTESDFEPVALAVEELAVADVESIDIVEIEAEAVETEPVFVASTFEAGDVVILETPVFATSSGLAVAQVTNSPAAHAGATVPSFITQPNVLLQMVYTVLAVIVVALLGASVVQEARRYHYHQVAYGVMLLVGMGGLWYAHSLLTMGAVII